MRDSFIARPSQVGTNQKSGSSGKPVVVLFVHHSNDLYGADVMLLETVRRLDPLRFSAHVVLPSDAKGTGGLCAELARIRVGVTWMPLPIFRRKYLRPRYLFSYLARSITSFFKLRSLILELEANIVHLNTLAVAPTALSVRAASVPIVWHVHEIIRRPVIVRRLMHRACAAFSQRVLCISLAVKDNLVLDQPAIQPIVRVIPNGIDTQHFAKQDRSSESLRFGRISSQSLLIGMIGRINQWKGQDVLIKAASLLRGEFPELNWVIVGSVFADEHHHREQIDAQLRELDLSDVVTILDFTDEVPSILSSLDIYVHLSKQPEPFGLAIVEAMSAELPVVATAPGGPSEIVLDGVTGLLVPPNDPASTAKALRELILNPETRKKMGAAGLERANTFYQVDRYVQQVEALYDEVLQENNKMPPLFQRLRLHGSAK